jgi:hypothetical protein
MITKNTSLEKEKSHHGCYCPECNLFIEETNLVGLSLICPYCGALM